MSNNNKAKIAVFPKGYMDEITNGEMDLFEWIEMAGTLDVEGLELYPTFLKEKKESYLSEVKKCARKNNLEIPMMCSSPDFTHPDPDFRKNEITKMKSMIDVMAFLGPEDFRSCRVLSGQDRPEITREDGIRWTVECITELIPYAAQQGVHLVIENHYKDGFWVYSEFAQEKDIFMEILSNISSPWFGVNYDPSNALFAGEDPIQFLTEVKNQIITLHASDRYLIDGYTLEDLEEHSNVGYSEALAHGVIGKGLNDYDEIFTQLKNVGFSNWISIEDGVNGLGDLQESVDFLKTKVAEYYDEGSE